MSILGQYTVGKPWNFLVDQCSHFNGTRLQSSCLSGQEGAVLWAASTRVPDFCTAAATGAAADAVGAAPEAAVKTSSQGLKKSIR